DVVTKHVPEHAYAEQWDTPGLKDELNRVLGIELPVEAWAKEEGITDEEMLNRIETRVDEHMAAKVGQWGPDVMRYVEKQILRQRQALQALPRQVRVGVSCNRRSCRVGKGARAPCPPFLLCA